jgi:hypothetical protein
MEVRGAFEELSMGTDLDFGLVDVSCFPILEYLVIAFSN